MESTSRSTGSSQAMGLWQHVCLSLDSLILCLCRSTSTWCVSPENAHGPSCNPAFTSTLSKRWELIPVSAGQSPSQVLGEGGALLVLVGPTGRTMEVSSAKEYTLSGQHLHTPIVYLSSLMALLTWAVTLRVCWPHHSGLSQGTLTFKSACICFVAQITLIEIFILASPLLLAPSWVGGCLWLCYKPSWLSRTSPVKCVCLIKEKTVFLSVLTLNTNTGWPDGQIIPQWTPTWYPINSVIVYLDLESISQVKCSQPRSQSPKTGSTLDAMTSSKLSPVLLNSRLQVKGCGNYLFLLGFHLVRQKGPWKPPLWPSCNLKGWQEGKAGGTRIRTVWGLGHDQSQCCRHSQPECSFLHT
jgi:hypothetical protein